MSFTPHEIIVAAIVLLIIAVVLAAHYFGILLREDRILTDNDESEEAVEIDDGDGYDTDEPYYQDDRPGKVEIAVEDDYLPPPSPEFTAKFREYYAEERTNQRLLRMRSFAPHLFDDDWYENTRSDFSQWSVEMREVYAIAS